MTLHCRTGPPVRLATAIAAASLMLAFAAAPAFASDLGCDRLYVAGNSTYYASAGPVSTPLDGSKQLVVQQQERQIKKDGVAIGFGPPNVMTGDQKIAGVNDINAPAPDFNQGGTKVVVGTIDSNVHSLAGIDPGSGTDSVVLMSASQDQTVQNVDRRGERRNL